MSIIQMFLAFADLCPFLVSLGTSTEKRPKDPYLHDDFWRSVLELALELADSTTDFVIIGRLPV